MEKSIVETGNGGYIMKPVEGIKDTVLSDSGIVPGQTTVIDAVFIQ